MPRLRRSAATWDRLSFWAIIIGILIRVAWGLGVHPPFEHVYSDMEGYVTRALRIVNGETLGPPDTFFPPGNHLLLAIPLALFGVGRTGLGMGGVLWCGLSSLVPFLAWRLARTLLTPAAAAITALLSAVWAPFIVYGGFFMSEVPALTFLLSSVVLAMLAGAADGRRRLVLGLAAGICGGTSIIIRPQFLLNVGLAALLLLVGHRRNRRALVLFVGGAGLPVTGAVLLTAQSAGEFVGLNQNAGMNFFQAHCDVRRVTTVGDFGSFWFAAPPAVQLNRGRDVTVLHHPPWEQQFFFDLGMACIRKKGLAHLGDVGRSILDLGATTDPWPPRDEPGLRAVVRPFNFGYTMLLPVTVFGSVLLIGLRRRQGQRSGEAIMLAHLSCVLVTALLFVGDPRYRIPYDVFGLALLAALLAHQLDLDERAPDQADP